jgi:2-polyprenyl-6-methoxyphenol hydroxylase-like FAD-dependent oxidoreductase
VRRAAPVKDLTRPGRRLVTARSSVLSKAAVDERRVIVVGGAIGGAATALLLARDGARVTLLERVREPGAVGAGIMLQPNGLAVLYGLGLGDRLRERAYRAGAVGIADGAGRPILQAPVSDFGAGLDHALVLRRSHLFGVLLDAVAAEPRIECRFGTEVLAVSGDGTVTYRHDGERGTLEGELVVGADGVHSCVREHGRFEARVVRGAWYLRGLAPPMAIDGLTEYWTGLGIFGAAPCGDGTYFYSSTSAPRLDEAAGRGDLWALRDAWAEVLPLAGEILRNVARFEDLLRNQVIRVDCHAFFAGSLVLVGDAAHAMAPNLGQGANSALVDAAVLAWELRHAPDQRQALERYDGRRRRAVRAVQDAADRVSRLSEVRQPTLRWLRDGVARRLAGMAGSQRASRAIQQEEPAWLLAASQGRN